MGQDFGQNMPYFYSFVHIFLTNRLRANGRFPSRLPIVHVGDRTTTLGQLPTRASSPQNTTHQDNYPPRTITPKGQLPPRTITPIGKLSCITSTAPHSLTRNGDKYFRDVGILEMIEKRGRYFVCYLFQSLACISKVFYIQYYIPEIRVVVRRSDCPI